MASSDDEEEMVPQSVTNYYFEDGNSEPISFAVLPVLFDDASEEPVAAEGQVFLHGTSDGGLQKVFKQVTAWRVGLQGDQPEISVLSKDGKWIKLLKPRKIYEEETARAALVTVHLLHFLKMKPESSEKSLWGHLDRVFSFENKPSEDDLKDHHALIKKFIERDETLAHCQLFPMFLKERSRMKISNEDVQNGPDAKKPFITDDDDADEGMGDDDGEDSEEEPDLFDSVCAICDNGGELLCCEGRCLRSFHATRSAGADSDCKSLGFSRSQVEAIQNFLCKNCQYKKHQCFACGKLGSSDKSAGAEVFPCVNATCGHFYHPKCAAQLLYRDNKAEATEYQKKIAAGESFMCPVHKCVVCDKGENKAVEDLQFAVCRRCPKSYHRQCLPREIAFDDMEEEDILQRAWDDLLPNRILIYCVDHEIDEELGTPIRNHIIFPEIPEKKIIDAQKTKVKLVQKKKSQYSDSMPVKKKQQDSDYLSRDETSVKPKKVTEKRLSTQEGGHSLVKSDLTTTGQVPEFKKKVKPLKPSAKPDSGKADGTVQLESKTSFKEKAKALTPTVPLFSGRKSSFPVIDSETEKRIMALMEKTSSSLTLEDIMRKRMVPSTHAYSGRHIDKSITHGKVEGSIEAIRTALKKVEDGGNVEDAKAVCEPDVLRQLLKWSSKLKVYLSPFLHGVRYTSFGRHFTKVDKLMEIVDKLQWYVQNGDMIVDFCCGANDFSQLMKEKLDAVGKKCLFKNYDVIQPKNDFSFEKRDWMKVQPKELPTGSQLIMGLNPPFGVKAALANKFIDKALTFKPKLIILIVPPETERLDKKSARYDLIWEDFQKLSGKSFYLPGSVDIYDKQIEQWNNTPPVLYLWSRPDWTAKHKAIALKQGHAGKELKESPSEESALERMVDAAPENECIEKVHKNREAAPGEEVARKEGNKYTEKSNKRPLEYHREGSRKTKKAKIKEVSEGGKVDEVSDMSISPSENTRDPRELSRGLVISDDRRGSRESSKGRDTPEAFGTPSERSNTPSERTSNYIPRSGSEFTALSGGRRSDSVENIDDIAKRYPAPSNREDMLNSGSRNWSGVGISSGIRSSEEQFLSYRRDMDAYDRKPFVHDNFNGYGRPSEADMHMQPRQYRIQGQEDLSQRSIFSLSGSDSFSQTGRFRLPPYGLSSSSAGSSTMNSYPPHPDEINYLRMGNAIPGGVLPPGRRDIPPDSIVFAQGPQHTYPHQGTPGWLND